MCEYSLVLRGQDGVEKTVLESVERIEREEGSYKAFNIFGESITFRGIFILFDGDSNRLLFEEGSA